MGGSPRLEGLLTGMQRVREHSKPYFHELDRVGLVGKEDPTHLSSSFRLK